MQLSLIKFVMALLIGITAGGLFCVAHGGDLPNKFERFSPLTVSEQFDAAINTKPAKSAQSSRNSGTAFFKSLLIPGWGQYVQGREHLAMMYFIGEVLLITGIIIERKYAGWLEDDYKLFAAQHADVSGGKSHEYYIDIGNWMDNRSFNEKRLRDRQYDRLYTDLRMAWSWDSDQNRREFKATRLASDHARQRALIMVGGLLLNHMISGIEASRVPKSRRMISLGSTINDEVAVLKIGITMR